MTFHFLVYQALNSSDPPLCYVLHYYLRLMACSLFCGLKQRIIKQFSFFVSMHHISGRNFIPGLFAFKLRLKPHFCCCFLLNWDFFHLCAVAELQLTLILYINSFIRSDSFFLRILPPLLLLSN